MANNTDWFPGTRAGQLAMSSEQSDDRLDIFIWNCSLLRAGLLHNISISGRISPCRYNRAARLEEEMKIYLDNCCFNRPYDDQRNIFNLVETEAKLVIQQLVKDETLKLVWSDVLDYENNDNPFEERRIKIAEWRNLASTIIDMDDEIVESARKLMTLGLRQKDASHIACAIYAKTDYFITVDKKILNKPIQDIIVINPLDFLRGTVNDD